MQFKLDGANLGSPVPVSGDEATLNIDGTAIPYLTLGSHTLTAVYTDSRSPVQLGSSTSNTVTIVVQSVALTVSSNPNPSTYPEAVTLTATVASPVVGTITFSVGGTPLGAPVPINGTTATTTIPAASLSVGLHPVQAVFSGNPAQPATVDQLVLSVPLTVTAANAHRFYGQPNPSPLQYSITGFVNNENQADVVTGIANLTTAPEFAAPGTYPIVVDASGLHATNYTFVPSNGTLTINKATPGENGTVPITLTSSLNPAIWGNEIELVAHLPINATGTVTFLDGANVIGTAPVSNNRANLFLNTLVVGTHPIVAYYSGNGNYNSATSSVLNQIVNKAILTVAANDQRRPYGIANPTLTTTITGFVNGDTNSVVSGTPVTTTTATITSPVGTYPISVALGSLAATNYSFLPVSGTLTIQQAVPPVTLTTTTPSVPANAPVTFTATVPADATGTIQFFDGPTLIGTSAIAGGTATITTSTLTQGTHTITAVYSGDGNYTTAGSPPLTQTITAPADFTVKNNTGPQLIPPGASASYKISITSVSAPFTNLVTLTATNLPPGATYTYTPPTVTPGVPGATSTFTVTVPPQTTASKRGSTGMPYVIMALLLPLTIWRASRRRPLRLLLWLIFSFTVIGSAIGCGVGGYFSLPEQTYVITVTGTSGSLVRSTTATLTVQ